MTEKLTACKDCTHKKIRIQYNSFSTRGRNMYRNGCEIKYKKKFLPIMGEGEKDYIPCVEKNTNGRCKDFEAKE